ncbi:srv-4 [Pristionchus pacificus]|uniref:Srv-4 n=1 Tax=Pristionchus pacificus TaxID=54126 RepID=A0A2A6CEA7_PRIPA|nr:srv-4 [Pristionchus pacificus]|eukprot:PDM76575.1 srv-4 [Pristionchus pacificus]
MSFDQMPLYHYVIMAVGWPSIVLYALMIVSIIKHRHNNALLRSSFFNMVLAEAIPEFILFFYVEFLMRTRKFGFLQIFKKQANSWLVEIVFFGHNSLRNVVILGFIPFALNRFMALRSPTSYTNTWTPRFTLFLILLCWIGGFVLAVPIYFYPSANFSYLPNKYGGLTLDASNDVLDYDSISAISTVSSVFGICSMLYLLSFLSLRRVLSSVAAKSSTRAKEDFLLMLSSVLTFSMMSFDVAVFAMQFIATAAGQNGLVSLSFDLWFVTTELMCISQPWCLLCTNRTVRRYFLRLIRLRHDTSTLEQKGVSRIEMRTGSNASSMPSIR